MRIETARLVIRDMVREDLDQILTWRPFEDPLEASWNLQWRDRQEMDRWFEQHVCDPSCRMYVVTLREGQVIGRLSLRQIHHPESAVLGIAFGADWVNQGYGTEALRAFARYYFDEMGFHTLLLDVAATNTRAVRCYEKCGFVKIAERHQPATWWEARVAQRPENAHLRCYLKRQFGRYWLLFYDMKLERQDLIESEGKG